MSGKTTIAKLWWPLMDAPTMKANRCYICGKPANNQHHMVKRSQGELYIGAVKRKKPTITLCGSGTTGCHGLAHQNRLHFRYVYKTNLDTARLLAGSANIAGQLEYLLCKEPTKYQEALHMTGWKPVKLPKEQA